MHNWPHPSVDELIPSLTRGSIVKLTLVAGVWVNQLQTVIVGDLTIHLLWDGTGAKMMIPTPTPLQFQQLGELALHLCWIVQQS